MRKFSSYGSIDTKLHFYAPRTALIENICHQLLGEDSNTGGHYITIWAPRQTGKSWITNQALQRLRVEQPAFDVVKLSLQSLSDQEDAEDVYKNIIGRLQQE